MIAPRRRRHIHLTMALPESVEERTANAQRTRTADTLHGGRAAVTHCRRISAQCQLHRQLAELRVAADGRVLLVQFAVEDLLFGLEDGRQHQRLAVVVAVRPNAKVDLLRVGVALERLGDAENRVGRTHLDVAEP